MSRPHRKKSGREKRNIFILLLMIAALSILISLAIQQGPITIMPSEPLPLKAQRQAADNAYFTLAKVLESLPPLALKPLPADRSRRAAGRVGYVLGLPMDDDDPQLRSYLEASAPAIALAREALAKPFYLCPEVGNADSGLDKLTDFRVVGRAFAAQGLSRAMNEGADAETFAYLLDGIRLGRMVAGDGPGFCYATGYAMQEFALLVLPEVARRTNSAEPLQAALDALKGFSDAPIPVIPSLEFRWRMLDNSLTMRPIGARKQGDRRRRRHRPHLVRELEFSRNIQKGQRFIIANRDLMLAMAVLPYPKYDQWRFDRPEFDEVYHPYCAITEELDELVKARASADAAMRGGCIVLALELHRLAQGHYPETLDALAPQFLSEVPADPFSEKPFVYKLVENDYLLYSAGANCLDDGGGLKNNDDLVIYAPADAADVKDLKEAVPPSVSEPVPSVEPPAEKAVPQPLPPPEPQPQAPPAPPQA